MKYLMIALISVFISLVCVPSATADNSREWSAGDIIQVGVLCKDEDTILEIVNADIKSERDVLLQMNQSILKGVCISFSMPAMFIVIKALVHYKDHRKRESVVLGVGNADRDFVGWALANGKFVVSKKENSI
jgi:hypothetical protein